MNAYVVTGLHTISNFMIVWLAVHAGLGSSFVFQISNAILIGSFVSFGVNVTVYSKSQHLITSVPNLAMGIIGFLCYMSVVGEMSLQVVLVTTVIFAIERKEKLRLLVSSRKAWPVKIYICVTIFCLATSTYVLSTSFPSEWAQNFLLALYLLPCLLIYGSEGKPIKFSKRLTALSTETLPFLSGFLVVSLPYAVLSGPEFNEFRLLLSYISLASPVLQLIITSRLQNLATENDASRVHANVALIFVTFALVLLALEFLLAALIFAAISSTILHALNKFETTQFGYAALSSLTPLFFIAGVGFLFVFDTANYKNTAFALFLATVIHVLVSWRRRHVN